MFGDEVVVVHESEKIGAPAARPRKNDSQAFSLLLGIAFFVIIFVGYSSSNMEHHGAHIRHAHLSEFVGKSRSDKLVVRLAQNHSHINHRIPSASGPVSQLQLDESSDVLPRDSTMLDSDEKDDEKRRFIDAGEISTDKKQVNSPKDAADEPGESRAGYMKRMKLKERIVGKQHRKASSMSKEEATDPAVVARVLRYWQNAEDSVRRSKALFPKTDSDKYLLFEIDFGGFNNIRMSYEFVVIMALLTGRTLVLPPPVGWYLIDWGPIKRDNIVGGTSDFGDFFDMKDLAKTVPWITTQELMRRHPTFLPKRARKKWPNHQQYLEALRQNSFKVSKMGLNPFDYILYYPSVHAVKKVTKNSEAAKSDLMRISGGREPKEFSKQVKDLPYILFPMDDPNKYRYLAQVSTMVAFADSAMYPAYKTVLKHSVHYLPQVFDIAARVIAFLGIFRYSSMHIRRNDLQYEEVFQSAGETMSKTRKLFNNQEVLYIATDETQDAFFDAIKREHRFFQWKDFFTPKGGNVLRDVEIPTKLIALVEQVICAGGRVFVGTQFSTYTAYIRRLRGYIGAPDLNEYFHNRMYETGGGGQKSHYAEGNEYNREDSSLWELKPPEY